MNKKTLCCAIMLLFSVHCKTTALPCPPKFLPGDTQKIKHFFTKLLKKLTPKKHNFKNTQKRKPAIKYKKLQ